MAKQQYEKIRAPFVYNGRSYEGDIVCSHMESGTYWYVFEKTGMQPFGGSLEFITVDGTLQPARQFPEHQEFLNCIIDIVRGHIGKLCR
jgi:hypothetical protein